MSSTSSWLAALVGSSMDSLLAYASSDEDEEAPPPQPSLPRASSLFSSLPKPQSTFLSSLPPPKKSSSSSHFLIPNLPKPTIDDSSSEISYPGPSKLFSAVPAPKKSQNSGKPLPPKRVIQIRPPVNPSFSKQSGESDDDDEDEGEKEKKRRRQSESAALTSSVHSLLFSMPAARGSSTLGALPSSGSGKRSVVIETDSNPPSYGENNQTGLHQISENHASIPCHGSVIDQTGGSYDSSYASNYSGYAAPNLGEAVTDQNNDVYHASYADQSGGNYEYYDNSYENYQMGVDQSTIGVETASYVGHDSYVNQGPSFGSGFSIGEVRALGKKKKGQIPAEIVEVKQDELMKNRPREDQMKSTGIAFGPSYQPVSTKGKPTKLHKRKHQIGSLYFDMKQKEMELNERRAKGFQTKAQTQGKYGW